MELLVLTEGFERLEPRSELWRDSVLIHKSGAGGTQQSLAGLYGKAGKNSGQIEFEAEAPLATRPVLALQDSGDLRPARGTKTDPSGMIHQIVSETMKNRGVNGIWSGLSESNRHLNLGKVPYYHYTKAAQRIIL
jgi:hypothetical protein